MCKFEGRLFLLHVPQQTKAFHVQKVITESELPPLVCLILLLSPTSQGAVLTPSMEHTMSLQPASMINPLAQQMSHLSLGNTGTVGGKLILSVSANRGG